MTRRLLVSLTFYLLTVVLIGLIDSRQGISERLPWFADQGDPIHLVWFAVAALIPAFLLCLLVAGGRGRKLLAVLQAVALGFVAGAGTDWLWDRLPKSWAVGAHWWSWDQSLLVASVVAAVYSLYRVFRSRSSGRAHEGPRARRSLVRRGLDAIFGYDFFVSYTRRDGGRDYAVALARQLEATGFEVFFDEDDYAMGDDWKVEGNWALRRTSQLILVASPKALSSPAVVREVAIYSTRKNRRVIPIDFGGTIRNRDEEQPVFKHLKPEILFLEEDTACLETGKPSEDVVKEIQAGFDLKRQDKKRSRIFGYVALVLVVLTVAALVAARVAVIKQKEAIANEKRAIAELARNYWNNGVTARDRDNEPLRATHYFTKLAEVSNDPATREAGLLSAASLQRGLRLDAVFDRVEELDFQYTVNGGQVRSATLPAANNSLDVETDGSGTKVQVMTHAQLLELLGVDDEDADATLDIVYGGERNRMSGGPDESFVFERETHRVSGAVFDSRNNYIRTTGSGGESRFWNGGTAASIPPPGDFAPDPASTVEDGFTSVLTPDRSRRLDWGGPRSLVLTDMADRKEIASMDVQGGTALGAVFSPDGSSLISWSEDVDASRGQLGTAQLWDADTGELVGTMYHEAIVSGAVFNDSGSRILTWDQDGTARLWDSAEATTSAREGGLTTKMPLPSDFDPNGPGRIEKLSVSEARSRVPEMPAGEETMEQGGFAFVSTEGNRALFWTREGTVSIWNAETQALHSTRGHVRINGAVFDSRAGRIFSWDDGRTSQLWDSGGQRIAVLELAVEGAVFGPAGNRILARGRNTVWLLDARDGTTLAVLGHDERARSAVFSPDASRILTSSADGAVRLWHAENGHPIKTVRLERVAGAVFNRDGSKFAAWSNDGRARVWDLATDSSADGDLVLGLEVRTGTTLSDAGQIEVLSHKAWKALKENGPARRAKTARRLVPRVPGR